MSVERFRSWVVLIVLVYAALQAAYVQRIPFVMDEFDGAQEAYRLRSQTPYRDYIPYKTVLGYYLQLPATFVASSNLGRLLALRFELLLINAAMLAAAAFYCARFFARRAVVLALALFAASTPMMERALEIRVDMLTGWAGMWSALFLMRRGYALAGLCAALSFMISQKAALYVVAADVVLIVAIIRDHPRRAAVRGFLVFNAAAAGALTAYLAIWSLISSPELVLRATFLAASRTATSTVYDIQGRFWSQVLVRNPLIFAIALVAVASILLMKASDAPGHSRAIAIYAAAMLAMSAIYTQPWPYFFVILFPVLFVLAAAFLSCLDERRRLTSVVVWTCVLTGIVYPLHRVFVLLGRDQHYQRYNISLAESLLDRDERYLAGNDVLHDRQQWPPALARIDGARLDALRRAEPALHRQLIRQMQDMPPKLVLGNYRTFALPDLIFDHIDKTYARLSGSVLLYAPLVDPGENTVEIDFPGRYRMELAAGDAAVVDGIRVRNGALLSMASGEHRIVTPAPARLRYLPVGIEQLIDSRFAAERPFYEKVYD